MKPDRAGARSVSFTLYGEGEPASSGSVAGQVLELAASGKIAHEWVTSLQ